MLILCKIGGIQPKNDILLPNVFRLLPSVFWLLPTCDRLLPDVDIFLPNKSFDRLENAKYLGGDVQGMGAIAERLGWFVIYDQISTYFSQIRRDCSQMCFDCSQVGFDCSQIMTYSSQTVTYCSQIFFLGAQDVKNMWEETVKAWAQSHDTWDDWCFLTKFRHTPPKWGMIAPKWWRNCAQMWRDCSQLCFDRSQKGVFVPSPPAKKKGDLGNLGGVGWLGRNQKKLGGIWRFCPYRSHKKINTPRYIATTWEDLIFFDSILPNCDRFLPNVFWLLPNMYTLLPNVFWSLPNVLWLLPNVHKKEPETARSLPQKCH